jgi:group I intron endonuclease
MEKRKQKAGIYQILNKINGRVYIGSSKNLEKRLAQHRYELKKGIHHNKFLQNDFNKLGKDFSNVEFSVIENEENFEKRLELEYKYISLSSKEKDSCYNHDKTPKALKDGECFKASMDMTKKKISESVRNAYRNPESIKRKSEASKLAWQNKESRERRILAIKNAHSTEEAKLKNSEKHKRLWQNEDFRQKHTKRLIDSGRIKPFQVIKDGEVIEIINLSEWCRENGMCEDSLFRLREGKTKKHKGMRLYIDPEVDKAIESK